MNANSTEVVPAHIMQGPSLIFDKSSPESLNLDEAVLLDISIPPSTVHRLLRAELCGRFNFSWTLGRPYVVGGRTAQRCAEAFPGALLVTRKRAS